MPNSRPLILPVKLLQRAGEPPKGLDGCGRWRRLMSMKQIFWVMMMMVVVLAATAGPATMAIFLKAVFNMRPVAEAPAEPALPDN